MSRKPAATAAILIIAMLEALMPWREARSESFEHGLLWRLERPGSVPSYVFGTLHSTDARAVALPPPVARAFARSRVLAVEVYLSDAEEADFFDAMQFDDGTRLERLLGAPWYAKLQRVLGASAPADDVLARTKPWAAWLRATAMPAASGVATPDRELFVQARKRRMEVIGLEGLDEQVALFDAIPLDTQIAVLRDALDRRDALQVQVEPTLRAWLDRDLGRLARINQAIGAGDPDLARHYAILTRHVIDARSALMAYRLFLPLRRGGVFAAAGALHLPGAQGSLSLLQEQGYRLARVY